MADVDEKTIEEFLQFLVKWGVQIDFNLWTASLGFSNSVDYLNSNSDPYHFFDSIIGKDLIESCDVNWQFLDKEWKKQLRGKDA